MNAVARHDANVAGGAGQVGGANDEAERVEIGERGESAGDDERERDRHARLARESTAGWYTDVQPNVQTKVQTDVLTTVPND